MLNEHKAQRLASVLREIRLQTGGLQLTATFKPGDDGQITKADISFLGRKMWFSLDSEEDPRLTAEAIISNLDKIASKIDASEIAILQKLRSSDPAPVEVAEYAEAPSEEPPPAEI